MKKTRFCWVFFFCFSGEILAGVNYSITTQHYDITGRTGWELRNEMNWKGPIDEKEHRRYDAYTAWRINWTRACDVTVRITHTYPRWTNQQGADPRLISEWNQYFSALKAHEQGHEKIATEGANRIASNCRAGEQILDEIRNKERKYDEKTNHGKKEGAQFY